MFESFSAPSSRETPSKQDRMRRSALALGTSLLQSPIGHSLRTLILPALLSAGCAEMQRDTQTAHIFAQASQSYVSRRMSPNEIADRAINLERTGLDFDRVEFFTTPSQTHREQRLRAERESSTRTPFGAFEVVGIDRSEFQRSVVASLPPSWTSTTNVNMVTFEDRDRQIGSYGPSLTHSDAHAAAQCTRSNANIPSQITFFRSSFFDRDAEHTIDGPHPNMSTLEWSVTRATYHEFMHSRDWFSSSHLTPEQREHLLAQTLNRLASPDHFSSPYVNAIDNTDRVERTRNQATEYIAVLAETAFTFDEITYRSEQSLPETIQTRQLLLLYLAERGGYGVQGAEADLALIEAFLHSTDPQFDLVESLPRRHAARTELLVSTYRRQIQIRENNLNVRMRSETERVWRRFETALRGNDFVSTAPALFHIPSFRSGQPEYTLFVQAIDLFHTEIATITDTALPNAADARLIRSLVSTISVFSEDDLTEEENTPEHRLTFLREQYDLLDRRIRLLTLLEARLQEAPELEQEITALGTAYREIRFSESYRAAIRRFFIANHRTPPL